MARRDASAPGMPDRRIKRHGTAAVALHWVVAVSSFALVVTGLGQIPLLSLITGPASPGETYEELFFVHLQLHYIFAALLIGAAVFHIFYHLFLTDCEMVPGKKDFQQMLKTVGFSTTVPQRHYKYYSSQKFSYLLTGFCLIGLILTGMLKVLKNLPAIQIPGLLIQFSTYLHLFFTALLLLSILAHLVAVHLVKKHRGLIPGILNGWISQEYARKHFPEWAAEAEREGL